MNDLSLAARRGLMVGALAGLWVALGDFGALWLWLPVPRDRAWLLVRLVATIAPLGGLLGAALAVAQHRVRDGLGPRHAWLAPVPFTVLALGPLLWLADQLCAGGAMQRLAARHPIALALRVLLPLGLLATLALGHRVARSVARRPARALPLGVALLALAVLLGKLNQWLLPNLYGYLHGLLALIVGSSAAFGFALLAWRAPRTARLGDVLDAPWVGRLAALVLAPIGFANATTLDHNLNVRVAMFDARSPTSRAILTVSDPLLRRLEHAPRPRGTRAASIARRGESLPASAPGAHVVLVTIDALRADHLGSYGYGRPVSPALDALAARGVRFDRAYAQAPHSSYSLSALHTSEYVHEVVELGRSLPTTTLARAFAEHGYHTAAFFTDGIFHTEGEKLTGLRDSAFGFALFDHTNREAEQQTDRVLAEADRIKQRGEPASLLWVHYFDVHEPYQETTFGSDEMDRYDSEILHVDRELQRLLRELDARFERPLLVAVTADHGEEFRDHGGVYHGSTLYDEQTRVPLLFSIPGVDPATVRAPVEVIDVAPTLLAAVGAPIPESMQGRDLRALLAAQPPLDERAVFSAVLTKRMALRWPLKLIADLRFGLYELYDLARDPEERKNLAGEKSAELEALRGLVYAWLDGVDARTGKDVAQAGPDAAWQRALHLGRLGDRRAVAPTAALLLDRAAPVALRVEAGQNLAKLADPSALPALLEGLTTEPEEVAHEAAIAIGRMYDPRAQDALRRLVHVEDPHVRARAAVSLGRLRDRAAVPALIDALWVAPSQYEREEAVRWLGRLGDPAAVEPLLSLLPEFGLRYLLAVALGEIGDRRAYPALSDMLAWESRTNIRDEVVRGLGLLGDPRAIPLLRDVLVREPALKNTAESLVRLGALERGALGGTDVGPDTRGLRGFDDCIAGPLRHDWDYLERTHCTATSTEVTLSMPLPRTLRGRDAVLVLRARRADASGPARCAVQVDAHALGTLAGTSAFAEQRFELPRTAVTDARATLTLRCEGDARLTVDHALIVPRPDAAEAPGSADAKAAGDAQLGP
ncbi:MAG: sulfatase-like hydrolase/transferase [Polyangiales bacterium]